MADESVPEIPEHPLLKKLGVANSGEVASFHGYAGPAVVETRLRIYATLQDLSRFVEFDRSDVLHFEKAPEALLPFGGIIVWLKKNAHVMTHHVEAGSAEALAAAKPGEMKSGRLRLSVPGRDGPTALSRQCSSSGPCDHDHGPPDK